MTLPRIPDHSEGETLSGFSDHASIEKKFHEWRRKMDERLKCKGKKGDTPVDGLVSNQHDCRFDSPVNQWNVRGTRTTTTFKDGKIAWNGITVVLSCPECGTPREVTFDGSVSEQ